ncbi:PREDICTED: F-box/WD-40 repeat-containing protein At3g52030 [Nelumbo nucifera]|uniref:F-box/WD-40 repeat-containing protein At3g52030 n=1 Tax=Nelumbo nucifera TaxID=4432 RepID=A0A1U8BDD1_NELNU|nr:PREDICTED: F-box/WD-40 repeat-containing protein At3g52030 [Nelumbo nucifera]
MEANRPFSTKRSSRTSIQSLDSDILCLIFAFLDWFDLARCSAVCTSWYNVIHKCNLWKKQYYKQQRGSACLPDISDFSETSWKMYYEGLAMEQHRLSLRDGSVCIDQWKGHSVGVHQCRMKMGLILTGGRDKVMRIWSSKSYKCLEEYSVPDVGHLVDFGFDENKIVGLVGTRVCIWRRHGERSIFPAREGTFSRGLCMRYIDPEAVVGCEDGTVRIFDMYSRQCSHIIRMRSGPVTCLALTDNQMILSGSSLGSITMAGLSSDQRVASLKSTDCTGIKSLCFNPRSHLVFAGSTSGCSHCWDLRTMKPLWQTRVGPNVVYSMQHLQSDKTALVVGGIDGVLRILNQDTGQLLSSYVMNEETGKSGSAEKRYGIIEKKRVRKLSEDIQIDSIPKLSRPPITCLAVGMKKVVTTHNGKLIRMWKFNK